MKKSIALCLFLVLMLLHAGYVTEGARYGLLLWYASVVPALFPFMVLSGLIVASGGVSVLMTPFYAALSPFLPISRDGCYVLVSGLLCGYPMGAKTCADFVREGRISAREGRFLMAVCNHPSPMFLLGYVYPFFAEYTRVPQLFISVYGPVAILAFLAKKLYFPKAGEAGRQPKVFSGGGSDRSMAADRPIPSAPMSADESILSAAEILCKIGGYLMLFSILIVFLRHAAFIPAALRLALIGAMEMTTGIRELASSLSFPFSGAAAAAALTFGGFSGLFQTKAVIGCRDRLSRQASDQIQPTGRADGIKNAGLSIRQYFFWKLLHGALSAGLFLLLVPRA